MKVVIGTILGFILYWGNIHCLNAQTQINVGADIVSSYVWRGMYQSGAAIQPMLACEINNFTIASWGSVDFNGQGKKEADITAAYSIRNFTLSITDYWWAGETFSNGRPNGKNRYFDLDNHTTAHILEAGVNYAFSFNENEFMLAWYTMIWGADKKESGNQSYSSYLGIGYAFQVKRVNVELNCGISPYKSCQYLNNDFAVTSASIKGCKEIHLSDKFSLPIYTQLVWNPNREDVHFIFGITL